MKQELMALVDSFLSREVLIYYGAIFVFCSMCYYALEVVLKKVPPISYTSWLMWLMLDALVTAATYSAGKPIWLPLGWTVGTLFVFLALFVRGSRKWAWGDTLCAVCAGVAGYLWYISGPEAGVIAYGSSLVVAGIPMAGEMWKKPARESEYLWLSNLTACSLSVIGSDWTLVGSFVPIASGSYCLAITFLARREPKGG